MFFRSSLLKPIILSLMLIPGLAGLCWSADQATRVFYVDADFAGENPTGTSWLSACRSLQEAIDQAGDAGGGEVWIKAGIYKPDEQARTSSFKLRPGVRLLGGFRGTETRSEERDPTAYRTILSGDVGQVGIDSDNSYHILTGCSDAVLDGIIFSRGNADGMDADANGAGVFIPAGTRRLSIIDCTFEKNVAGWQGGALFVEQAQLDLTNCTFYSNGSANGGAVATSGKTALKVSHSSFSSNFSRNSGGALFVQPNTDLALTESTFLYNSAQIAGGAIAATSKIEADLTADIQNCTFVGNSAEKKGGALFFEGSFFPVINRCHFVRNSSRLGAGAIANQGGVRAVVTSCEFNKNQGAKGVENIGNDALSLVVKDTVSVAAVPNPAAIPEEQSKRQLPDAHVFDGQNEKHTLQELARTKKLAVFVLGELTDPDFIESYRDIEAIARDYTPLDVQFFYIYRFLSHPENNGYLQPFSQLERARQMQLATELLKTNIPWLYDTMDNQSARGLAPDQKNSVFVYSEQGEELFAGVISDSDSLRDALVNLAGASETKSNANHIHSPQIEPINPIKPEFIERVHFDPEKEKFVPLEITPMGSQLPYYVKLRAEADADLLRSGDGKIYLGFHVDPLYQVQWNDEGDPFKYEIRSITGAVSPSVGSAPAINPQDMDKEPREFVLKARQLDLTKPLMLRVQYSMYVPTLKKNIDLRQQYLINLREDPCGGQAYRRQISYQDEPIHHDETSTAIPYALRQYDSNKDGKLSRNEVSGNLWSKFPDIDTNHDGYLNIEEYANYLTNK